MLSRHERSEGRRTSGKAEKLHSLRARTSSQTYLERLQRFVLIIAQTCQHVIMPKHATNMPKVHATVCSRKTTQLARQKGKHEGTLKETKFPPKRTASRPMARLEQSSTGGETKKELRPEKGASGGASHPSSPRLEL